MGGCSGEGPEPSDSGAQDSWTESPQAADPEPIWSVEEVGAELQHFMDQGVPGGRVIAEVFGELMSHGEGPCPGAPLALVNTYLGCETPEGYYYSGVGWLFYALKRASDGVALEWVHGGDFELGRPDGSTFSGGGDMYHVPVVAESGPVVPDGSLQTGSESDLLEAAGTVERWSVDFHGSWADSSRDDWLENFSGIIRAEGREDRSTGERLLWIHGGLAVDDVDLFYDQTLWYGDDRCTQGVVGTIRLRDPRGYWFSWELGEDCDACGELTFHQDQSMGELCVDLSEYSRQTYEAWANN
jgi:hypothetical protein